MYAIKEAVIAKEHDRSVEPTIFFMDMRAFGKDFDKYYERARDEYGVRFVRSRVAKVDRRARRHAGRGLRDRGRAPRARAVRHGRAVGGPGALQGHARS